MPSAKPPVKLAKPPSKTTLRYRDLLANLATRLHAHRPPPPPFRPPPASSPTTLKIVCISDTHNARPALPPGDMLLHAGDLTRSGTFPELQAQLTWLAAQPHTFKVIVAGNHDLLLDPRFLDAHPERGLGRDGESLADLDWGEVKYLQDESVTLEFPEKGGRVINVYGSPTTMQCGAFAFQVPPVRDVWSCVVPRDTDVLLTHGPPRGYLDGKRMGSPFLTREVVGVRPELVVFGHIHEGRGMEDVVFDKAMQLRDCVVEGWCGLGGLVRLGVDVALERVKGRERGAKVTRMVNAAIVDGGNVFEPMVTYM